MQTWFILKPAFNNGKRNIVHKVFNCFGGNRRYPFDFAVNNVIREFSEDF